MVFQRDLVRAAEHFLRVARYVFPSPIGDPCELPRSLFLDSFRFVDNTGVGGSTGGAGVLTRGACAATRLER